MNEDEGIELKMKWQWKKLRKKEKDGNKKEESKLKWKEKEKKRKRRGLSKRKKKYEIQKLQVLFNLIINLLQVSWRGFNKFHKGRSLSNLTCCRTLSRNKRRNQIYLQVSVQVNFLSNVMTLKLLASHLFILSIISSQFYFFNVQPTLAVKPS